MPAAVAREVGHAVELVVARKRQLVVQLVVSALGLGMFVAVTTVSFAADRQIAADFDALRATVVRASAVDGSPGSTWITQQGLDRVRALPGVEQIDVIANHGDHVVSVFPPHAAYLAAEYSLPVLAVQSAGPTALSAQIRGTVLKAPVQGGVPTVLIGAQAAEVLGIEAPDGRRLIWLEGHPFLLAGVVTDGGRRGDVRQSVVVAHDAAQSLFGAAATTELLVQVAPGAGAVVSKHLPAALRPEAAESVLAVAPPDPGMFRLQIQDRVRQSLLALSAVVVLTGALLLSSSAQQSVRSRTGEIGLRRALGATRGAIFRLVLSETALVGLVGGVAGASLGILGALGAMRTLGWVPVLEPLTPPLAAAAGMIIGVVAGIRPARRAARSDPAQALRLID